MGSVGRAGVGLCVALAVLVGAVMAAVPAARLPAVGLAAAVALAGLGPRRLLVALVGATFVTLFRFPILGMHFRLEHFVLVVCALALLLAGRGPALAEAAGDRTAVLFGVFLAWSALVSVLQAEQVDESLQIVGWLALDWVLLVVVVAARCDPRALVRWGAGWAGVAAGVALVLWAGSRLAGTSLGVQEEPLTGVQAAAGLSYEANLLATTLALWLFITLAWGRAAGAPARAAVVALAAAGMAVSFTRAAVVGLVAGLLVWAVTSGRIARRSVVRFLAAAALGAVALGVLAPSVARPMGQKAAELANLGSGTGQLRAESWAVAVRDLSGADWIVGKGTNSFGQRHHDPTRPGERRPGFLPNLPLAILYEVGLVGVALVVGILASALPARAWSDGRVLGLVVVYLLCGVATSSFWFGTTWLLVAVAVVRRKAAAVPPGAGAGAVPALQPFRSTT